MGVPKPEVQSSVVYDDAMDIFDGIDIEKEIPPKPKKKPGYPHRLRVKISSRSDCDDFAKLIRQPLSSDNKKVVFSSKGKGNPQSWRFEERRTKPKKQKTSHRTRIESQLWVGVTEFENDPIEHYIVFEVTFETEKDYVEYARRVKIPLSLQQHSMYFPKREEDDTKYEWVSDVEDCNPKYPVYIISKGRADSRFTSKTLERMRVPYFIVIEPQDYYDYECVIDPQKIKILPFSNHGMGSGVARNWCGDHARKNGFKRHWILDDNINGFFRLHQNKKIRVADGLIFKLAEEFVDRFTNVPFASFDYTFQTFASEGNPPFTTNTRCYSCLLIDSHLNKTLPWEGRYNEDIDLTIRVLKAGLCTIQFQTFLQGKMGTQLLSGGNTEEIYGKGTAEKGLMLAKRHPDCVTFAWKYGREHHHADLSKWKETNQLIRTKKKHRTQPVSMSLVPVSEKSPFRKTHRRSLKNQINKKNKGLLWSQWGLGGSEGRKILRHMGIIDSTVDYLSQVEPQRIYNHLDTILPINEVVGFADDLWKSRHVYRSSDWLEVYKKINVASFESYKRLLVVGGVLKSPDFNRDSKLVGVFPNSKSSLKFRQVSDVLIDYLTILKIHNEFGTPIHELIFDPLEFSFDLVDDKLKPKQNHFKYHGYNIPEYGIRRLDSLQYHFSKFEDHEPTNQPKELDFVFGYTAGWGSDRGKYQTYINRLEKKFENTRMFKKTDEEDNTVDSDTYLWFISRSKYTLILPAYDTKCFSIYRLIESLQYNCLPLIHPDCQTADVEESYDVDLSPIVGNKIPSEKRRRELLEYLKSKILSVEARI